MNSTIIDLKESIEATTKTLVGLKRKLEEETRAISSAKTEEDENALMHMQQRIGVCASEHRSSSRDNQHALVTSMRNFELYSNRIAGDAKMVVACDVLSTAALSGSCAKNYYGASCTDCETSRRDRRNALEVIKAHNYALWRDMTTLSYDWIGVKNHRP